MCVSMDIYLGLTLGNNQRNHRHYDTGLGKRVGVAECLMFITEVQANGNGRQVMRSAQSELQKRNAICRQVMRPPPQSELRKRNAICVLIMELQANGNGGYVTRPPPQSELPKRNALCVLIMNCR